MELNFLIQPEEFEKNGIVPISLDLEKTLDDLVRLESMIRQHVPDFRLESIPDDDAKTFAILSKGETEGIPLLNDKWIRKYLSIMEPSNLNELDALISLYHNGRLICYRCTWMQRGECFHMNIWPFRKLKRLKERMRSSCIKSRL